MADSKASFLWAIKQQESGGDYNIVNQSSGALGAYQVMPDNVASWTQQALGKSLSPQQYLSDPSAQEAVANKILGDYYDQYGARGAAAMWYSGQPDPNKTYGTPSVADYVKSILDRMTTASPVGGVTDAGTNIPTPLGPIPLPGGVGNDLAKGLETGLVSAFKAVVTPTLSWIIWVLEAGLGMAMIGFGAFLVISKTPVGQEVKSETKEVAVATPAGQVAKKAAPAKKTAAPSKDYVQRTQARQASARKKAQTPPTYEKQDKARVADINKRMKAGRKSE